MVVVDLVVLDPEGFVVQDPEGFVVLDPEGFVVLDPVEVEDEHGLGRRGIFTQLH